MAKQALGKGLGALIKKNQSLPGQAPVGSSDDSPRVREIEIDNVVPSPLQPRAHFIDAPLDDLVDSIRQHGIIQPLIARLVDGKHELIAGERRWRASKKLGLTTVPVIERAASDRDVLEMALIENLQREDLNPIEEAAGYVRLAKEFTLKQEEIATRVGKSRASVANAMRLLDLHPDIQSNLAQGQITVGHAKAILALKDADTQKLAADQIIRRKLTVRIWFLNPSMRRMRPISGSPAPVISLTVSSARAEPVMPVTAPTTPTSSQASAAGGISEIQQR